MVRDSAAAEFTARLFDLTRVTEYYVEANDIRSRVVQADASPICPRSAEVLPRAPLPRLHRACRSSGSKTAATSRRCAAPRSPCARRPAAPSRSGSIRLDDGTTVPLAADTAGRLTGSFRIAKDGFYRVDLVATDGTAVPGAVQYVIEALDDRAPIGAGSRSRVATPRSPRSKRSPSRVRASDDYGVTGSSCATRCQRWRGAADRPRRFDARSAPARLPRGAHTFFLEELGLKPGDLVAYYATGARWWRQQGIERHLLPGGASVRSGLQAGRVGRRRRRRRWRQPGRSLGPAAGLSWPAPSTGCATARG